MNSNEAHGLPSYGGSVSEGLNGCLICDFVLTTGGQMEAHDCFLGRVLVEVMRKKHMSSCLLFR